MRILVLGAAAGGGFPQWNCGCANCRLARSGSPAARPRTQCGIAVSTDDRSWVLVNASPDLRQQILASSRLAPAGPRHSPIAAVVLTCAEIDAVAGLLTLRERQPYTLYGTGKTLAALAANPIFGALDPALVRRQALAVGREETILGPGGPTGLTVSLFLVPGKVPLYLETPDAVQAIGAETEDSVGLAIRDSRSTVFFIPGCAELSTGLRDRLRGADLVLFDGTMWDDDEMIRLGLGEKTARRMGHVGMSGPDGSLAGFEGLGVRRKVFIHLNNTNPALIDGSPEHRAVTAAGWEVAFDGMEIVPHESVPCENVPSESVS